MDKIICRISHIKSDNAPCSFIYIFQHSPGPELLLEATCAVYTLITAMIIENKAF